VQGKDVVSTGADSNDEATEIDGTWREAKPYIRIVPQLTLIDRGRSGAGGPWNASSPRPGRGRLCRSRPLLLTVGTGFVNRVRFAGLGCVWRVSWRARGDRSGSGWNSCRSERRVVMR
jgi:hypothetical protein